MCGQSKMLRGRSAAVRADVGPPRGANRPISSDLVRVARTFWRPSVRCSREIRRNSRYKSVKRTLKVTTNIASLSRLTQDRVGWIALVPKKCTGPCLAESYRGETPGFCSRLRPCGCHARASRACCGTAHAWCRGVACSHGCRQCSAGATYTTVPIHDRRVI